MKALCWRYVGVMEAPQKHYEGATRPSLRRYDAIIEALRERYEDTTNPL